jgi:hypothetical protein
VFVREVEMLKEFLLKKSQSMREVAKAPPPRKNAPPANHQISTPVIDNFPAVPLIGREAESPVKTNCKIKLQALNNYKFYLKYPRPKKHTETNPKTKILG